MNMQQNGVHMNPHNREMICNYKGNAISTMNIASDQFGAGEQIHYYINQGPCPQGKA